MAILSVLGSLGFSFESIILFGVLFFFYIKLGHKIELLSKDNEHIKQTLNNHITDTNKKIEQLDSKFDKRIDNLESKIDQHFKK